MTQMTSESFQSVVASALERMAFVIADPTERTSTEVVAEATHHAAVAIGDESPQFVLMVSATDGLLVEVAANMMGLDNEEIDCAEQGAAIIAELANVFAGELAMVLGGVEASPRLGLPEAISGQVANTLLARSADSSLAGERFAFALASESGCLAVAAHPA